MMVKAGHWISMAAFVLSTAAVAGGRTGADILLRGTGQSAPSKANVAPNQPVDESQSLSQFKLDDPFTVQLFSVWQNQRSQLPPELNHWVTLQLKQDFEPAAHLWGGIEKQLPASFALAARLAHLRALTRLGLVQSAMESWIELLTQSPSAWSSPGKPSPMTLAFENSWATLLGKPLDQALFDRGFSMPAELNSAVSKLNPRSLASVATLQAVAALRQGEQGKALLELLPPANLFKLPVAQTVALALARRGDLGAAAQTLKVHAESALEAQRNLVKVSSHLIQIARFLFQAGLWEESETYLRKIPNTAPEFLSAREELAWVLLRKGDVQALRGELASLSTPGTRDAFQPELPVVRAISNLKLCSYGAVQRDFADFQASYGEWARRIESALAGADIPAPPNKDGYTIRAEKRVETLASESQRLTTFHTRSLESGLPSVVGRQSHWKLASNTLLVREQAAKKQVQAEYRRQWKNHKMLLSEAIRKLRFVKVELLHQMRVLASAPSLDGTVSDGVSVSQAAPRAAEGHVVFPLDGVLWPDEFFRIQGVVEQRCLKGLSK